MWVHYALEAAVIANLLAQAIKVSLHYLTKKKWNFRIIFSTGGMPSSHAAFVVALATALAISEGVRSPYFAISVVLACVVIYDSIGIRRHAGTHAAMWNKFLDDLIHSDLTQFQDPVYQERFKEALGHEPAETFVGILLGILVAFAYGYVIFGKLG